MVFKIDLMSRNSAFSKVFIEDKLAGGTKLTMRFLRTFSDYNPKIEFTGFDLCPVLMIHPEKDEWTPYHLSKKNYVKIKGQKQAYLLSECGHAPVEKPGIFEMEKHIVQFMKKIKKQ